MDEAPWGRRGMRRFLLPGYEALRSVSPYEEFGALQKRRTQPKGIGHSRMGSTPVRTRRMDLKREQRGMEARRKAVAYALADMRCFLVEWGEKLCEPTQGRRDVNFVGGI